MATIDLETYQFYGLRAFDYKKPPPRKPGNSKSFANVRGRVAGIGSAETRSFLTAGASSRGRKRGRRR